MRCKKPSSTHRELGYHPTGRADRAEMMEDVGCTLRKVTQHRLKDDTQLADTLHALRSRVAQLDYHRVRPTPDMRIIHDNGAAVARWLSLD